MVMGYFTGNSCLRKEGGNITDI